MTGRADWIMFKLHFTTAVVKCNFTMIQSARTVATAVVISLVQFFQKQTVTRGVRNFDNTLRTQTVLCYGVAGRIVLAVVGYKRSFVCVAFVSLVICTTPFGTVFFSV